MIKNVSASLASYRETLARLVKPAHKYTTQEVIEHKAIILYDDHRRIGNVKSIVGYTPRTDL